VSNESDPRAYFAAERTLLAWLRTGLTVIGLGFLVARFGLFMQLVRQPINEHPAPIGSSVIGVGFVLFGTTMIAAAALQHARFSRGLAEGELPPRYWSTMGIWVSAFMAAMGVVLAVYLLCSVPVG
jgi:putative membrane protein